MLKEIAKTDGGFSNRLEVITPEDELEIANLVRVAFTVKPTKDSPVRFVLDWDLDFSNCTRHEMLTLAARQIKVDIASKWRGDSERMNETKWSNIVIDVAEQLRAKPARASAASKLEKLVPTLNKEEKAALLARLLADAEDAELAELEAEEASED